MAYRRRRRTTRTRGYVSRAIKRYALGILFVMLGAFIIGVVGYLVSLVPASTLTIGSVNITNTSILQFITWIGGILFVLTGIKKFGIPL
jgi:cell division septal protein FtsQ